MSPRFLSLDQVLRTHRSLIETYGGEEGLRDAGLLHSAVAMPMAMYGGAFLHADLFEMAAAYLYHITQNHPFLDGNKRTGAACAIIFLTLNNIEIEGDEDGLVEITLRVATGEAGKDEIAAFFRSIARGEEDMQKGEMPSGDIESCGQRLRRSSIESLLSNNQSRVIHVTRKPNKAGKAYMDAIQGDAEAQEGLE